jgi:hypothetical protein
MINPQLGCFRFTEQNKAIKQSNKAETIGIGSYNSATIGAKIVLHLPTTFVAPNISPKNEDLK